MWHRSHRQSRAPRVAVPAGAKRGMEIEVFPEIPAGSHHKASVKVIDRLLDAASGTFGVRLELPNRQHNLPGGIRCMARFPGIEGTAVKAQSRPPATMKEAR